MILSPPPDGGGSVVCMLVRHASCIVPAGIKGLVVFGRFLWAPDLVSDPPGSILRGGTLGGIS